jgi:hypothetical protein
MSSTIPPKLTSSQRTAIKRMVKGTADLSKPERAFALLLAHGFSPSDLRWLEEITPGQVRDLVNSVLFRTNANEAAIRRRQESPSGRFERRAARNAKQQRKAAETGGERP